MLKIICHYFAAIIIIFFSDHCWSDSENNLEKNTGSINNIFEDYEIPAGLKQLLKSYPQHLKSVAGNTLIWRDDTVMIYDDGIKNKTYEMLLNSPDLEDQMSMPYPENQYPEIYRENFDPGRIRFEPFFLKMYGNSEAEVRKNLVSIRWLPKTVNKPLMITSVNGVDKKLQAISDELDMLPKHLKKYVIKTAGTFNWRMVAGTKRLSPHSFGIAVDIDVKYGNYWRWDISESDQKLNYKNKIPSEIIEIFEKHGFIWGGKWYHYDTIHFEYRPELLINFKP